MTRINNKIEALEKETKTIREEISNDQKRIQELAEQSQLFHNKMVLKLENAVELKLKADKAHMQFIEHRKKAKEFHSRYNLIQRQVKVLLSEIQKSEEEEKAKLQAERMKEVKKEALEKLQKGKKLSFEEFKILAEHGEI